MNRQGLWVSGLVAAVMVSAIAVVEAKHENRKLFSELQMLEKQRNQMDVEWGRLQLEQGTWSSHSRIERIAHKRLNMYVPEADATVIIKE